MSKELKRCLMCRGEVESESLGDWRFRYRCRGCGQFFELNAPTKMAADLIYNSYIGREETEMEKLSQLYTYRHRGYVLQQTSFNWHYMIFDEETGGMVLHASCTEKLSEEEAKKHIDMYIDLRRK